MFFLEGNIGTGKSTFLELVERAGLDVIYEPVNEWSSMKNSNGKNLLEEFYGNQSRYAYTFQSIAFRTRVKNISNSKPETVVERSIFTDRNVFAKTCYENGMMNDIEWEDYTSWFDWLSESFNIKPNGYIYLQAPPEVSHGRIMERNRSGEETIPFEYLEKLHNKHEEWLKNEENVLFLDATKNFKDDEKVFEEMLVKVKKFINVK
jgi:deoxyadenosine/deoxycytidine kinase